MSQLVLQDGTKLEGTAIGAPVSRVGEVVFNTGMVGYPESLTDPSYRGQILVFTYPLIGNYGVPSETRSPDGILENFESEIIHASAVIVNTASQDVSHPEAVQSFSAWLKVHNIPGLAGIDTRALTEKLREHGTMLGKVEIEKENVRVAGDQPLLWRDQNARNLVQEVSIRRPITYRPVMSKMAKKKDRLKRIVLVDCGVKNNMIRALLSRNLEVIRVPWDYPIFSNQEHFDGIIVSNGPGDPKMCKDTIAMLQEAMKRDVPIFGICLGHQLLALASGADTYKLKYGHRSANQPCLLFGTERGYITSQNHGFAVNGKSLKRGFEPWFTNANDGTIEGIRHRTKPWMSVQFHPEATPGPTDTEFLFDEFVDVLMAYRN